MLGDERIATFQNQSDDSPKTLDDDKLIYHISDHLNSSSLDVSSTGVLLQASDYLPFGKSNTYEVSNKRIKGKKGGYVNKYKFANKQEDTETDLQYFEKRYYDNRIGRFTTEDPVFWEVGLTKRPSQYFTDPQQWNSYGYVRNNPVNLVDPTGELLAGDVSNPIIDIAEGTAFIAGTVIRGYYLAVNFAITEGPYLASTVAYLASSNQPIVDAVSTSGNPPPSGGNNNGGPKNNGDKGGKGTSTKAESGKINTNKGSMNLSDHAKDQMKERGVTKEQVVNTINKGGQFKYKDLQSGQIRTGFYDKINNIFVGKGDNVTTVIKPKGGQTYINNLKAR